LVTALTPSWRERRIIDVRLNEREQGLILVLAVLAVGYIWYLVWYQPLEKTIAALKTETALLRARMEQGGPAAQATVLPAESFVPQSLQAETLVYDCWRLAEAHRLRLSGITLLPVEEEGSYPLASGRFALTCQGTFSALLAFSTALESGESGWHRLDSLTLQARGQTQDQEVEGRMEFRTFFRAPAAGGVADALPSANL
jgi:hypothetical protein